jgi:PPK2 family polyphosphate:nucleotide phosphotransferase
MTSKNITNSQQFPSPNYCRYRITPEHPIVLANFDPDETESYKSKQDVKKELKKQCKRLAKLQERLYAQNKYSLLIVLQAMDTGGKDGTIKHVFSRVNPQGCRVWSFKAPTTAELSHDFLWRYHQRTPKRGMITIFNRSHYEDILVVRVKQLVSPEVWQKRYQMINEFERWLTLNNTKVIKFFLHISKNEQKRRLEKRLRNPDKRWKFSSNDLKERKFWDTYQYAFEDAINQCSTVDAPWYVIPANKKWYRNLVVARTVADAIEQLNPQYPEPELNLEEWIIAD